MPELEKRRAELERRVAKLNAAEQQLAATKGKRGGAKGGIGSLVTGCFGGGAHVDAVEQRAQEGAAAANAADDDGVAVPTEQQNAEEDAAVQMADKDRKLEAARAMFDEKEAQVFEQLRALCNDATWLKSYMGSQLMRFKELMQEAPFWLGDTKQALPTFPSPPDLNGKIADNMDIVTGMPLVLEKHERRAALAPGWEEKVRSMPTRAAPSSRLLSKGSGSSLGPGATSMKATEA